MGILFSRGGPSDGHGFFGDASSQLLSKSDTWKDSGAARKNMDPTFRLKFNKRDGSYTIKVSLDFCESLLFLAMCCASKMQSAYQVDVWMCRRSMIERM